MKYIATREGVEILYGEGPVTKKQVALIENLLHDFPDTKELFEYADYATTPNFQSASAFISAAVDYNAHEIQDGDIYMKYIATRPRAEKHGEHGLFSTAPDVDLNAALKELEEHQGTVWTLIYSLRREDAARLGYDSAASWRNLIITYQAAMAEAMKISPENFRWYAAFHDEGHHPHIHMMVWSADPQEGYLSRAGIKAMRSKLTNAIFKDEMYNLYEQKDISYKELTAEAQATMQKLLAEMQRHVCASPVIEQHMEELVLVLGEAKGKKQYQYLKKDAKALVDAIVDELGMLPEVAKCYDAWNKIRDELESYYKDKPREHLPLSQQKEFRVIKNMVIREAENIRLGVFTFEDEEMQDEPQLQELPEAAILSESSELPELPPLPDLPIPADVPAPQADDPTAADLLTGYWKKQWRNGHPWAAHILGKLFRDGVYVPQNMEQAEQWFRTSAESGNDVSEFVLGKLLIEQDRRFEGYAWLDRAVRHGNHYAMYRMGKASLTGDYLKQDTGQAVDYFKASARQGNPYAQYTLGKLYWQGRGVPQDKEEALRWLEFSAAQGNVYAQHLIDHIHDQRDPDLLLCTSRILRDVVRVMRQRTVPPSNPQGIRIDSHRRKRLLEIRMSMGHKIDDHEDQAQGQQYMM